MPSEFTHRFHSEKILTTPKALPRPASASPTRSSIIFRPLLLLAIPPIFLIPFLLRHIASPAFLSFRRGLSSIPLPCRPSSDPGLTVVQLAFNVSSAAPDHKMIEHNCAMVRRSRGRHKLVVYTDDMTRPYCSACQCQEFKKIGCTCPNPSEGDCSLCEKLLFFREQIVTKGQLFFLDSDLIILKESFLDRFAHRAAMHDFLARPAPGAQGYAATLNSGLVFIRKVKGLDYLGLERLRWTLRGNNDQNALTKFVLGHYDNWDTLSPRWHCRYVQTVDADIPLDSCYTVHSRQGYLYVLKKLNRTLLTV